MNDLQDRLRYQFQALLSFPLVDRHSFDQFVSSDLQGIYILEKPYLQFQVRQKQRFQIFDGYGG